MVLRQLRYFVTVAQEGSVARASRKVRVAQPALSRHIHSLEKELGAPLFERERRGMRLTRTGAALVDGARTLLAKVEHAFSRTQLAHDGKLGARRLALGRVALQSSAIGRAITMIRERFPDIQLVVNEVPSFSQVQSLRAGEIDVAVGVRGSGTESAISHEVLYADWVDRALLPTTHPLAKAAAIEPQQLKQERLMMLGTAALAGFSELFDALRALGLSRWEEYQSPETVYAMVAAGRGWTTHIRSVATPPGTIAVPLRGLRVPLQVVVRWKRGDTSRLTSNVVAALRASGGDGAAGEKGAAKRREPARRQSGERRVVKASPDFELRQLRSYMVAVEEGSLSRAAPRMGLTASGLSRQIRALERELGVPLLQRAAPGVAPTAAGDVFRAEADAILTLADDVLAQARRAERGIAGSCRIGTVPGEVSGELLHAVLRQMGEGSPGIAVEVTEVLTSRQIPALRQREIDVGLAGAYPGLIDDPSIASVRLSEDVVECALVAASHPLASRASVKPSELAKEPFLFIARSTYPKLYDTVLEAFDDIGLVPMMAGSFNGPRAVWRLAADGMGWTVGTRSMRANPLPGLVAVPIDGLRIPAGIQLLWRRDEKDAGVRTVVDAFRERVQPTAPAM